MFVATDPGKRDSDQLQAAPESLKQRITSGLHVQRDAKELPAECASAEPPGGTDVGTLRKAEGVFSAVQAVTLKGAHLHFLKPKKADPATPGPTHSFPL